MKFDDIVLKYCESFDTIIQEDISKIGNTRAYQYFQVKPNHLNDFELVCAKRMQAAGTQLTLVRPNQPPTPNSVRILNPAPQQPDEYLDAQVVQTIYNYTKTHNGYINLPDIYKQLVSSRVNLKPWGKNDPREIMEEIFGVLKGLSADQIIDVAQAPKTQPQQPAAPRNPQGYGRQTPNPNTQTTGPSRLTGLGTDLYRRVAQSQPTIGR